MAFKSIRSVVQIFDGLVTFPTSIHRSRPILKKKLFWWTTPNETYSSYTSQQFYSSYYQDRSNINHEHPAHSALAQYGGRFTVTMIPGDGIGPEMMAFVKEVFRYAGVPVDFEKVDLDFNHVETEDFLNAIIAIKRNGVALKGSIESQYGEHVDGISRNAALRTNLDLFANVLHCKSYPGVRSRHKDIDIVIIRQNTEGEYSMLEHENVTGVIESMKIITRNQSERLARYSFEWAKRNNRSKITCVHKANIMKLSDGLFLESCKKIAKDYPEIDFDNMIVDNTCMQLVAKPHQFDVMVTPNLYGTVISNVVCGLVGGSGLISGKNFGDRYAVFEPGTRNTGSSIAGRNLANPVAMLNAACDLLEYLQLNHHADLIKTAIAKTLNEDKIHTTDIGGQATSIDVIQNIIKTIQANTENCPPFFMDFDPKKGSNFPIWNEQNKP